MEYFTLLVSLLNLSLMCYLLYIIKLPDDHFEPHDVSPTSDDHLSPYEKDRIENDRLFDERIEKLKNELAIYATHGSVERAGTPAVELHPGVKNIPHQAIRMKDDEEEYAK